MFCSVSVGSKQQSPHSADCRRRIAPELGYSRAVSNGLLPEGFDIVSTGWLRFLPEPALDAYLAFWGFGGSQLGEGDLDELGSEALQIERFGGLDAVYEPDPEVDEGLWLERWREFQGYAAAYELPMETPRDTIQFMRRIGLLERREEGSLVFWAPVVPVPLAESVLDLDEETREREADLRWASAFQQAENAVTGWLVDGRTSAPTSMHRITLTELAGRLELDVDDVRQGLAHACDVGDIAAHPPAQNAEPDQPLVITVDWELFDQERIAISFAVPDDND
jgi:hypothetical protein